MEKIPIIPSENYISLQEASKNSGYHPDYLGYLLRKGRIKGTRIGRDWFTTPEAIKTYISGKKFILLKNFLFSKNKPKLIFQLLGALILILMGIGAFLIFSSETYFQKAPGDFTPLELQTKNIGNLKVTTYSSDSAGGVEISLQPESGILTGKEKPSFFQRFKEFFEKIK